MRTKPLALAASAILGTSLLLTGGSPALASPGTPATRTAFEAKPIIWKKCPKGLLRDLKAQCGFLVVPLDHSRPKGKKIRLAVSRIKHTAKKADYQGALLINPGGPGGAGRDEVLQSILVSEKVGAAYDWIGFDPRGVGASRPALSCDSKHTGYDRPPYVPNTAAGEKIWLERSKDYAAKCAKAGGALLDNLKTTDNVKDMEILRRALGKKKISFLGYSYGSYLGQVYATQHPNRVHRMVLDGVVDARKTWYESNLEQNHAFERNMDAFFAWIATKHSTYRLGRTGAAVEKQFYKQLAALDKKAAGGRIGGDEWTDIFLSSGYASNVWADNAELFAGWVHERRWKPLKAVFDSDNPQGPGEDNGNAVYLGTTCTDAEWPADWSKVEKDNRASHRRSPFLTWSNAWFNGPCLTWAGKSGTMPKVDGSKAPPILLVSETYDAATPYEGALEARSRFPKSALLEGVGGRSHSASSLGSKCTKTTIDTYLLTGKLPKRVPGRTSDKQCAPSFRP
ncbi:alpha/beta hydrolase [Kineosporia rhizophila]|uniref:alpha/beta hydrolase n=1 Tax=Kineosporia rhizophila TaxID=84633 RepID=UPI001E2D128A|nr:alpha/beta hydrolase [Kineosporia rhizophila]MCE0535694.1 alpha/beta hydrolase [Kineosporia rhizophila]